MELVSFLVLVLSRSLEMEIRCQESRQQNRLILQVKGTSFREHVAGARISGFGKVVCEVVE
jgi:hypothetical protein